MTIQVTIANSFFGMEYLLDAASRCAYQRMAFEEFIAETHLAYTACGGALRAFIETLPADARNAWAATHGIFKKTFEGFEYE